MLVSHGLYGGFDPGLALAGIHLGEGLRIIAPSRFGYLGSTLEGHASSAGQADAYVSILDRLGMDCAAVFGSPAAARRPSTGLGYRSGPRRPLTRCFAPLTVQAPIRLSVPASSRGAL